MRGSPLAMSVRKPLQHAISLLARSLVIGRRTRRARVADRSDMQIVAAGFREFVVDELGRALAEDDALLPLTCRVERVLRRRGVAAGGVA